MERGQTLATLGTTALEYGATVLGRHSGTKTMLLGSSTIVRLISSLWHSALALLYKSQRKTPSLVTGGVSVKSGCGNLPVRWNNSPIYSL